MVAVTSHVFNTKGFVSPYIMQYKKILPMMWANNTGWDDNLVNKRKQDENGQMIDAATAPEATKLSQEWFVDVTQL
jgi:hypothetical protein